MDFQVKNIFFHKKRGRKDDGNDEDGNNNPTDPTKRGK